MPIFEFECFDCGEVFEKLVMPRDINPILTDCLVYVDAYGDPGLAERVEISAANFKVNGYNEKNGYSNH